jgi:single-stranded DNA-binding protein
MNNLNSLLLEGVVIGEPHYLEEKGVLNFSIETTRYYRTKEGDLVPETSLFKVECFGKMATLSLEEGKDVRIVGRLKLSKWKSEGVTYSEVLVVAEHIEVKITK